MGRGRELDEGDGGDGTSDCGRAAAGDSEGEGRLRGGSGDAGADADGASGGSGILGTAGSLGCDPFGLTGLLESARKAVGVDPVLESDDTLMASAVALEDLRGLVDATEARVLGHLDATAATDAAVGMRTARWLAWEADTGKKKCSTRVAAAKRLGWFDGFTEALTEGRVSYAHGELLVSVANIRNREALRQVQHMLIDIAVSYSFDEWARIVRQLAVDLDQDGSYDPNEDPDANRLRITNHPDGTADVKARLVGDAAVTVTQTLERIADELFHRYQRDAEVDPSLLVPSRARLMAEALVEMSRRAEAVDLESTRKPGVEATIIIDQDPEAELLEDLKGAGESESGEPDSSEPGYASGGEASGGAAPHRDSPGDGDVRSSRYRKIRCRDLSGRFIPTSAAEILLADPVIRGLLLDGDGVPLYLGDRVRFATPEQKTALAVRDGGCIFPGCDLPPAWCDAHHQPGWKPDGSTDIDKMFLACRRHHGVTHRRGWRCAPDPDRPQQWIWTTPTGRELHSQRNRGHPD